MEVGEQSKPHTSKIEVCSKMGSHKIWQYLVDKKNTLSSTMLTDQGPVLQKINPKSTRNQKHGKTNAVKVIGELSPFLNIFSEHGPMYHVYVILQ